MNRLIGKDPDAGKDGRQEEKGTTEDEMAGWHHQLDGQSLSKLQKMVKDRRAWRAAVHGVAESDMTDRLNHNTVKTLHACGGHVVSPFPP